MFPKVNFKDFELILGLFESGELQKMLKEKCPEYFDYIPTKYVHVRTSYNTVVEFKLPVDTSLKEIHGLLKLEVGDGFIEPLKNNLFVGDVLETKLQVFEQERISLIVKKEKETNQSLITFIGVSLTTLFGLFIFKKLKLF